jgi:hypothetical protein
MKQSTGTYTSASVTAPQSRQKAISPSQYCSFYKAVSHKVSHALHTYSGRHSDLSVPQHIGGDQWNGYLSESSTEMETVNFFYRNVSAFYEITIISDYLHHPCCPEYGTSVL